MYTLFKMKRVFIHLVCFIFRNVLRKETSAIGLRKTGSAIYCGIDLTTSSPTSINYLNFKVLYP